MSSDAALHPLGTYFKIWTLLFVLSAFSYAVDYFHLEGTLRWTLILAFMLLKAGFIMAIFMHLAWERVALVSALLSPPIAILFLIGFMWFEGTFTQSTRMEYFGEKSVRPDWHHGQHLEKADAKAH